MKDNLDDDIDDEDEEIDVDDNDIIKADIDEEL